MQIKEIKHGMVTIEIQVHEKIWNQIQDMAQKKGMDTELFILCALTIGLEVEKQRLNG